MSEDIRLVKQGKVRDIYEIVGEDKLVIVTTDRISVFDVILPSTIPLKGVVLNQISATAFRLIEDEMDIYTHFITADNNNMPEMFQTEAFLGRCMMVKKLQTPPQIESIVRGYIIGSGWESYQKTGKVCGIDLPSGLKKAQKLPEPIYTPTTKAEEGHDEHISFEDSKSILGEKVATEIRDKSLRIYTAGAKYALERGIIIADTKFEFGLNKDGEVVLCDEVFTPDSSRFWPANEYEVGTNPKSFDKQYVRDYEKSVGFDGNQTPQPLPPEVIKKTLQKYLDAYLLLAQRVPSVEALISKYLKENQ